jgi:hypothetical protein
MLSSLLFRLYLSLGIAFLRAYGIIVVGGMVEMKKKNLWVVEVYDPIEDRIFFTRTLCQKRARWTN